MLNEPPEESQQTADMGLGAPMMAGDEVVMNEPALETGSSWSAIGSADAGGVVTNAAGTVLEAQ